ncbi:MAG: hypothetical protein KJ718_00295 [Nanoarchaeota archaeon]|nr:hypothetical protein [Nanoarchaeota archaeon]MBU1050980.1 hypothetical protein [Nanoarchaeota archaeon]MBU1988024.1 hypothetical protein [Nanoarchaeota archaeon]
MKNRNYQNRLAESLYEEAESLLVESIREISLAIAGLKEIRAEWQEENKLYLRSSISLN